MFTWTRTGYSMSSEFLTNRWSPFILVIFCFICYLLSLTFSASNWQTFSSIILISTLGWNILEIKTDLKVWFCFSSTLTLPACLKTRGFCLSSVNSNRRDYEGDRTERDEPVCGKTFAPFVFIFFLNDLEASPWTLWEVVIPPTSGLLFHISQLGGNHIRPAEM